MRITPLIRPMKEGDVDIVARLRCDAFFEGANRTVTEDAEGLRQLLLDGRFEVAFVAELNGIPIGSCLFIKSELDAAHDLTPWLAGLVVAPDHRGRGIGQQLVRTVETHALSIGVVELYLYTWEATAFYHALGWQAVDTFLQNGQPMMLMSRQLAGERQWPR
jgi:predicted N-acetyltransferase YhbS